MSTDSNLPDTTAEAKSTVDGAVETPDLAEDIPETESKPTESGSGDSDIKMD